MAIVGSNTYNDEDDDTSGSSTGANGAPVKSGVVNLSEAPEAGSPTGTVPTGNVANVSGGTSGTSVNTATPATAGNQSDQSGSWTNLNDYLAANQGASNNLGSRVLNTVNTAANQGTNIINSAGQSFAGDVNTGTDTYNAGLSQDALANPTAFLQTPEYTQLVNELTGTYTGPSDWGSSTEAANAVAGEQSAEQTAGLGLTSQGRQQILNQTSASPYTQGEGSLNEFLLDNNQSQLQPITQAANVGGNLQGQYQQVSQNAGNEVTAGTNTSAATGAQAKNDILGGQTTLVNQLTQQAQQAAQQDTTQGQQINSLLSQNSPINDTPPTQTSDGVPASIPAPQLTSAEITSLGITPAQYNTLIALNQQAIAAGAPGIQFSTYYTEPNTSGITPASQATAQQISDFNALNTLVPGSNQQFLSGATGSPSTPNGTFDYAGATTALQAQIAAAQAAAQQTKTAQSATTPAAGTGSSSLPTAAQAASTLIGALQLLKIGDKLYNQIVQATGQTPAQITKTLQTGTPAQIAQLSQAIGPILSIPASELAVPATVVAPPITAPTPAMTVTDADTNAPVADTNTGTDVNPAATTDPTATTPATTDPTATVDNPQGFTDSVDNGGTFTTTTNPDGSVTLTDPDGDVVEIDPQTLQDADQAVQQTVQASPSSVGLTQSQITNVVSVVGLVYSIYQLTQSWQSGATGQDAIGGASVGASMGAILAADAGLFAAYGSWAGPLGTAVGAAIGAVVGALSSIFGGGKPDVETNQLYNYDQEYAQDPSVATNNTPAQNFQIITGVFDGKDDTPGHATAIEQIFGRMGETNFISQMTAKINQAINSGQIPPSSSAEDIYSKVVDPWLASFPGNYGAGQTTGQILTTDVDADGNAMGVPLVAAIESLISQWQTGEFDNNTVVGAQDQIMTSLPAYAGASSFAPWTPPSMGAPTDISPTGPQAQATAQANAAAAVQAAQEAAAVQAAADAAAAAATTAADQKAAAAAQAAAAQATAQAQAAAMAAEQQYYASQGYYGQ